MSDPSTHRTARVVFAKNEAGDEFYKSDIHKNEMYPGRNFYARYRDGKYRYAVDAKGNVVFPKDDFGNEEYIPNGDDDEIDGLERLEKCRYARKKDGSEIYPQHNVEESGGIGEEKNTERVEGYMKKVGYARNIDSKYFYPLGLAGREYFFRAESGLPPPSDYPISGEGNYLIPIRKNLNRVKIINLISTPKEVSEKIKSIKEKKSLPMVEVYPEIFHLETQTKSKRFPRSLQSDDEEESPSETNEKSDVDVFSETESEVKNGDEESVDVFSETESEVKNGDEETAKNGDEETAKNGDEETVKNGDEETAKNGDEETVKNGDEETMDVFSETESEVKNGDEETVKTRPAVSIWDLFSSAYIWIALIFAIVGCTYWIWKKKILNFFERTMG